MLYLLIGYVFEGVPVPAAVLLIKSIVFDGANITVNAEVFPSQAIQQARGVGIAGQWSYPATDCQPVATVFAALQAMTGLQTVDNNPISLAGATAIVGA